ncbi:MAG: uroporphyrinogen-III synthase [Candidatus Sericytochromatia bacterium]|nr:uroporphyrinogen-III synthase [Candidatus Sericytochromatia bacterium]
MLKGPDALCGAVVWLTRDREANEAWRGPFEAAGAQVVSLPCIAVEARHVEGLLQRVAAADWLVLTSPQAVRALAAGLGGDRPPDRVRLAVVGEATGVAAGHAGWRVDLVARRPDAAGLVETLKAETTLAGTRVCWPRSSQADEGPLETLRAAGAVLDAFAAYDTVAPPGLERHLAAALVETPPDWIVLASGSACRHLRAARPAGQPLLPARIAAIGARTAEAVEAAGWPVAAVASVPTAAAMLTAMRAAPGR